MHTFNDIPNEILFTALKLKSVKELKDLILSSPDTRTQECARYVLFSLESNEAYEIQAQFLTSWQKKMIKDDSLSFIKTDIDKLTWLKLLNTIIHKSVTRYEHKIRCLAFSNTLMNSSINSEVIAEMSHSDGFIFANVFQILLPSHLDQAQVETFENMIKFNTFTPPMTHRILNMLPILSRDLKLKLLKYFLNILSKDSPNLHMSAAERIVNAMKSMRLTKEEDSIIGDTLIKIGEMSFSWEATHTLESKTSLILNLVDMLSEDSKKKLLADLEEPNDLDCYREVTIKMHLSKYYTFEEKLTQIEGSLQDLEIIGDLAEIKFTGQWLRKIKTEVDSLSDENNERNAYRERISRIVQKSYEHIVSKLLTNDWGDFHVCTLIEGIYHFLPTEQQYYIQEYFTNLALNPSNRVHDCLHMFEGIFPQMTHSDIMAILNKFNRELLITIGAEGFGFMISPFFSAITNDTVKRMRELRRKMPLTSADDRLVESELQKRIKVLLKIFSTLKESLNTFVVDVALDGIRHLCAVITADDFEDAGLESLIALITRIIDNDLSHLPEELMPEDKKRVFEHAEKGVKLLAVLAKKIGGTNHGEKLVEQFLRILRIEDQFFLDTDEPVSEQAYTGIFETHNAINVALSKLTDKIQAAHGEKVDSQLLQDYQTLESRRDTMIRRVFSVMLLVNKQLLTAKGDANRLYIPLIKRCTLFDVLLSSLLSVAQDKKAIMAKFDELIAENEGKYPSNSSRFLIRSYQELTTYISRQNIKFHERMRLVSPQDHLAYQEQTALLTSMMKHPQSTAMADFKTKISPWMLSSEKVKIMMPLLSQDEINQLIDRDLSVFDWKNSEKFVPPSNDANEKIRMTALSRLALFSLTHEQEEVLMSHWVSFSLEMMKTLFKLLSNDSKKKLFQSFKNSFPSVCTHMMKSIFWNWFEPKDRLLNLISLLAQSNNFQLRNSGALEHSLSCLNQEAHLIPKDQGLAKNFNAVVTELYSLCVKHNSNANVSLISASLPFFNRVQKNMILSIHFENLDKFKLSATLTSVEHDSAVFLGNLAGSLDHNDRMRLITFLEHRLTLEGMQSVPKDICMIIVHLARALRNDIPKYYAAIDELCERYSAQRYFIGKLLEKIRSFNQPELMDIIWLAIDELSPVYKQHGFELCTLTQLAESLKLTRKNGNNPRAVECALSTILNRLKDFGNTEVFAQEIFLPELKRIIREHKTFDDNVIELASQCLQLIAVRLADEKKNELIKDLIHDLSRCQDNMASPERGEVYSKLLVHLIPQASERSVHCQSVISLKGGSEFYSALLKAFAESQLWLITRNSQPTTVNIPLIMSSIPADNHKREIQENDGEKVIKKMKHV